MGLNIAPDPHSAAGPGSAPASRLLRARVMHRRLRPGFRPFQYCVYYLLLPLSQLHPDRIGRTLALNRPGLQSFHEADHGARDGSPLQPWLQQILERYGLRELVSETLLLAIPRALGRVFNPVSFWFCLDAAGTLRAVLCEVNNTFGETHSYLCLHQDRRPIGARDWLQAQKLFHVSPFLERQGHYRFRFSLQEERLGVWIDYFAADGARQLLSSLTGALHPLNRKELRRAFLAHPLLGWKTLGAIHWQGLKLFLRGAGYRPRPAALPQKCSASLPDDSPAAGVEQR